MKLELKNVNELPEEWNTYDFVLSGYRVNYDKKGSLASILDIRQNEFWMIWTDLVPFVSFVYVYILFLNSEYYNNFNGFYKITTSSIYIGMIISRCFSCLYHIFHCMSLKLNQRLIYFDLIGISQGALGVPWVLALALKVKNGNENILYGNILYIFWIYYLMTISSLTCLLFYRHNEYIKYVSMFLLVSMGIAGNSIVLYVILDDSQNAIIREYFTKALLSLCTGLLIYVTKVPEIFFPVGTSDSKFWNSHVFWHNFVTVSQIYFIRSTMI
jgi:hypothetical protein